MKRTVALIPAAGSGSRFGAARPKQYLDIGGKSVLRHTLERLLPHPQIDHVAVVVSAGDPYIQTALPAAETKLSIHPCGGDSRARSVANGINSLFEQGLAAEGDDILVHDAARCCLPASALARLLAAEAPHGAILAVPVADTLKSAAAGGRIERTVPRSGLWQAQTPQRFPAALLRDALSQADLDAVTDEASAVEALGLQPQLVLGDIRNLKLTLPQDEILIRLLLQTDLSENHP